MRKSSGSSVIVFTVALMFAAWTAQCNGWSAEVGSWPGTGTGSMTGRGSGPGTGPGPKTGIGPGSETGLGTGPEPENGPMTGREPGTGPMTGHGPMIGPWLGTGLGPRPGVGTGPLQVGFYQGKCKWADVEAIVGGVVKGLYIKDPTIAPALIRMQFHDCFVNGCDASILLDGSNAEKTAFPNLSVRGYEVIDAAKAAVENICPGVVSCADIIIMAARDVVALSGGGRYLVPTGRKDGKVSLASNVNLPAPFISVPDSIKAFAQKGLDINDMIYLLGGHTIGVTHCSLIQTRLYNFQNTGKPDPTMDYALLASLRSRCPPNATVDNPVNLDQNPMSSMIVDNSYYKQILLKRGVLQIDQELALDPNSKLTVMGIAGGYDFATKFGQAMIKLSTVQVLTGVPGEVRSLCRVINKPA